MEEKEGKNTFLYRLQSFAIILGFTFAFFAVGCMAGWLAELLAGKVVDLAGWGGLFGMAGFFVGVLFLMQQNPSE